ncbi:zinc finger matrin type 4 [Cricetulus griseus]
MLITNTYGKCAQTCADILLLSPAATPLSSLKAPRVDTAPVVTPPYQRRDSDRYCGLCAAWFNNPLMAQQHYDGKKHKKNAARVALLEQLGTSLDLGELRGKSNPFIVCSPTRLSANLVVSENRMVAHNMVP